MERDGRRAYCCAFCRGPYYTQLRDALYCAECFEKHVSRKFRKSLGELPRSGDMLVVVEENMQSVVMAHLLRRLVSEASPRKMHYFVASQNALAPHFTLEALAHYSNMGGHSRSGVLGCETRRLAFAAAKSGGFVGILIAEPLESAVRQSLVSLLQGRGREAVLPVCTQNLCGIRMVNVLLGIPRRGVSAYFFLYRNELPFLKKNPHTGLIASIEKFLESVRLRNCGAHNSFVEVMRKAGTQDLCFCTACCQYHRISEACG